VKKIIPLLLFYILLLPNIVFADCASCATQNAIARSTTSYYTQCPDNPIAQQYLYQSVGSFCGPDSYNQAWAAIGNVGGVVYLGDVCGIPGVAYNDVGFWYKTGSVTQEQRTCLNETEQTLEYSYYQKIYYFAVFCRSTVPEACSCFEEEELYCLLRTYACPDGTPVGLEYSLCEDDMPTVGQFCGSFDWVERFNEEVDNETYGLDGTITEHTCSCAYDIDEIDALCSSIQSGENCDQPIECEFDEDCDGVEDDNDLCPGTPFGVDVDGWGCPLDNSEEEPTDSDGDGVNDDEDNCPNTPGGVPVDGSGCEILDDKPTDDEGNFTGDEDNDNALLKGIISWLIKIHGSLEDILGLISKDDNSYQRIINDSLDQANEAQQYVDSTISDAEDVYSTDFTEDLGEYSNLTDKFDFSAYLTDFFDNNPITDSLVGIDVQASGDCSLSFDYKGTPVELGLCDYSSALNSFGSVMLMIAGFCGILIVFRR